MDDKAAYRAKLTSFLRDELGIKPRNIEVYDQAFTHRSLIHENNWEAHRSNERLEFLGDSVLGLAVVTELTKRYGSADEGDLSKMKAQLGSRATLGGVAQRLQLGRFLQVGRGEESARAQNLPSLVGNTLEALVGAVYLDRGFDEASRFVVELLAPEFEKDLVAKDYKSVLQEFAQRRFRTSPFYQVLRAHGPEHRKMFEVAMKLNGKVYGRGRGHTKKDAEQDAARHTLERFRYTADSMTHLVQGGSLESANETKWYWPFAKKQKRLI